MSEQSGSLKGETLSNAACGSWKSLIKVSKIEQIAAAGAVQPCARLPLEVSSEVAAIYRHMSKRLV